VSAALLEPAPDAVDREMLAAFACRYPDAAFGPVFVVVAAYREAASVARVVQEMPREICGLAVSTLVVDDGSDDGTGDVAEAAGAYVCRCAVNRGQGAALRLGYQIALDRGAEYVATTDADGQYDPGELPRLLGPVVAGGADFVSGSRRLGRTEQRDRVRRVGVVFYAAVIRGLTGVRVTDPSFGLRAMRAAVVATVTLQQPQFQAAELLIATGMRGFRVAEEPCVMRERTSGRSRKGPDIVYGYRFGRVVVRTWWRERRRSGARRAIA
jgi:glycosyltransferase involved in cell wall biosynthesis